MFYGIASSSEARPYLAHPVLGVRLRECVDAMNALPTRDPVAVLGKVDADKFRSCLTLFLAVDPHDFSFRSALDKFYDGMPDERTLESLDG